MPHHGQFARVVKGVDLRSTAGNCAWVRTPQLTNDFLVQGFDIAFCVMAEKAKTRDRASQWVFGGDFARKAPMHRTWRR